MVTSTAPKLYELADDLAPLVAELVDAGGEITPELETALSAARLPFVEKAERVALHVRNLEAFAAGASQEIKRLQLLLSARANAADSLKRYLKEQMERVQETKIETARVRVRIQRNSVPHIRWLGSNDTIPEGFRRICVDLDGIKARAAFKAGTLPEGFEATVGSHLRIE